MANISIREAIPDDVDDMFSALVGIAEAVGERHKLKSSPDDLRRNGFGAAARFETLIAEVDGHFAGCCIHFPSFSTWRGRPGVYVQDLYVAEAFRGQGVGERLLYRLASVIRARGGCYMRLAVDRRNGDAVRVAIVEGLRQVGGVRPRQRRR